MLKKIKGPVCLIIAFSLAGSSVIPARLISEKLGTFTIGAISLLLAVLTLIPITAKKAVETIRTFSIREVTEVLLQAFFGIFLFRVLFLNGMLYTSSVEAGILTGATPAVTVLLGKLILKEKSTRRKKYGALISIIGVFLIQGLLNKGSGLKLSHIVGNILILGAAASESVFNILSRSAALNNKSNGVKKTDPLVQTLFVTFTAFIMCLAFSFFENPVQRIMYIGINEWIALILYGVFITAFGFFFLYSGIKECETFSVAAFSGMMPFTSMLLSVFLLGEKAHLLQWFGAMMVISGMYIIGAGEGEGEKIHIKKTKEKAA